MTWPPPCRRNRATPIPTCALPADPHEIDDAAMPRVRAALAGLRRWTTPALRRWFGRFITSTAPPANWRRPAPAPAHRDRLATPWPRAAVLQRHPHARHGLGARGQARAACTPTAWAHAHAAWRSRPAAGRRRRDRRRGSGQSVDADGRAALHGPAGTGPLSRRETQPPPSETDDPRRLPRRPRRLRTPTSADLRHVRETVFVAEQQVPIDEEWDELDPLCRM